MIFSVSQTGPPLNGQTAAPYLYAALFDIQQTGRALFVRHRLGLFADPLTPPPCRKGGLFAMQSRKRQHNSRRSAGQFATQSSRTQHSRSRLTRDCLLCQKRKTLFTSQPRQIACICAGLFGMQSARSDSQPAAQRQAMKRKSKPGAAAPCGAMRQRRKLHRIGLYKPCKSALYLPRRHCQNVCTRPFQTFSCHSTICVSRRTNRRQASRDDPSPQNMVGWRRVFVKFRKIIEAKKSNIGF